MDTASMVVIDKWLGRVSNRNRHAEPIAPVEFENLVAFLPSAAMARGGLRPISFTNATTASTANIIAAYRYDKPESEIIVYENTDGEIHAGRGPSV